MALTAKKANDAIQELIDEGKLTEESLKDIINQLPRSQRPRWECI
jgi:polyhydroxyalkanoate synthesis regulator phasin